VQRRSCSLYSALYFVHCFMYHVQSTIFRIVKNCTCTNKPFVNSLGYFAKMPRELHTCLGKAAMRNCFYQNSRVAKPLVKTIFLDSPSKLHCTVILYYLKCGDFKNYSWRNSCLPRTFFITAHSYYNNSTMQFYNSIIIHLLRNIMNTSPYRSWLH
jgi:hypothetical protein